MRSQIPSRKYSEHQKRMCRCADGGSAKNSMLGLGARSSDAYPQSGDKAELEAALGQVMFGACRMRSRGLRQAEYHHRHSISRAAGNVARSLSSWTTNHNPQCSPKSTLWPTSASRLLARFRHMAAVCPSYNNLFAASLTIARTCQESTRSLATRPDQAVHNLDANSTQERCNRPSSLKVISRLSSTHLPLSGVFERLLIRTTCTARQEARPL
jgi:hypothetical protein